MKITPVSFLAVSRARRRLSVLLIGLFSAAAAPAQSLVFHYEFSETSGTLVSDSAGDYDLSLRGATGWGTGISGGGLSLNATSAGMNTGATGTGFIGDAAINMTKYTVAGWYQVSGTPSGTLLNLVNSAGGGFRITFDSGNAMIISTQGRSITSTTSSIISGSAGEWVFFALTIDTTLATAGTNWVNAVKLYVANENSAGLTQVMNKGLGNATDNSLSAAALSGIDAIYLGNNSASTAANYRAMHSGAILDEIRLYDGVFDEASLDAIRLSSIPEPGTSAVAAGFGAIATALMARRRSAR